MNIRPYRFVATRESRIATMPVSVLARMSQGTGCSGTLDYAGGGPWPPCGRLRPRAGTDNWPSALAGRGSDRTLW